MTMAITMSNLRTYSELCKLRTIEDRYMYLKLQGVVGQATFGFDRWLNQMLYTSGQWRETRDKVIIRDNACDLGVEGYDITDRIHIHHMNPLTEKDIIEWRPEMFDMEYLITTSAARSHPAIHYGNIDLLPKLLIERQPWDTCPWKQINREDNYK